MPTTRLSRSIPFWVLVAGSLAAIAGGATLLIMKLSVMAATLTDGSATGVEVYAGQTWAVVGAILVGVGLVGLALALTLGALSTAVGARAVPAVEAVEVADVTAAPVWESEPVVDAPASRAEARAAAAPATAPATVADEPEIEFGTADETAPDAEVAPDTATDSDAPRA